MFKGLICKQGWRETPAFCWTKAAWRLSLSKEKMLYNERDGTRPIQRDQRPYIVFMT